jgi:hypothetical protein
VASDRDAGPEIVAISDGISSACEEDAVDGNGMSTKYTIHIATCIRVMINLFLAVPKIVGTQWCGSRPRIRHGEEYGMLLLYHPTARRM